MFSFDLLDSWSFRLDDYDIRVLCLETFRSMCLLFISGKKFASPPLGWPEKTAVSAVCRRLQLVLGFCPLWCPCMRLLGTSIDLHPFDRPRVLDHADWACHIINDGQRFERYDPLPQFDP